ncbi:ATP-grasp fold amidoligase family protein [uncultured Acetatifactor sp.]|uniref:ATP-grasp fold amidoligase family protein n=1 Tax=uncultured Acetatifactor sp. TaxID=1671927 RepID=UPI00261704E7|nr:ATP-grasp fold amidoligase family protein [uncultured Acetatifactor sp.]
MHIYCQSFWGGYLCAENLQKDWSAFPNQFVVKCNHGCGYNILVTNKEETDLNQVIKQLDIWMKEDFWKAYCEPQYKDIEKHIIVEEYLGNDIQTYKFYCFNGRPKVLYISSNGENGEKDLYLDYYDMGWNWLPISLEGHEHAKMKAMKPKNFEGMVEVAEELSSEFPFVRVDLYNLDGRIYFSELTFVPTGGNMKLKPESVLEEWGSWLHL